MAVQLNHTIVKAHDRRATADFIAEILGNGEPESFADDHFVIVRLSNDVSLDVMWVEEEFDAEHYAFLVTEEEFDEIFDRLKRKNVDYFADPLAQEAGEINHLDGGRGVYFSGPTGHTLEVITRPYGKDVEEIGRANERALQGRFRGLTV